MRTKVAVATAALLLALVGCSSADETTDPAAETTDPAAGATAPENPTPPAPDLEGVPDVVAVVGGVEISREDFERVYTGQLQQAFMQAQTTGQEVDQDQLKQQTAEGLVDTELLLAEAGARSISPSEEEVAAAAEDLAVSSGLGSADELFSMLEQQGMGREEALAELELQTVVEQLVSDEAGEFTPSEEDARALYDEAAAQAGEESELPPFEDVRPQIEAQLQQEYEGQAVNALLEQLRQDAEITYNL